MLFSSIEKPQELPTICIIEGNFFFTIPKIRDRFVNSICRSLSALSLHFKFRSMLQTFGLLPESTQLLKCESPHNKKKKTFDFPSFLFSHRYYSLLLKLSNRTSLKESGRNLLRLVALLHLARKDVLFSHNNYSILLL